MIALKAKQSALKGQLTIISNQLDAHPNTPLTVSRYKTIKEKLDEHLAKSVLLNEEIFVAGDATEQAAQLVEHEVLYLRILELIDRLVAIEDPGGNAHSSSSTQKSTKGVQLPKVKLPTFSGDMKEWISFHDLFGSLIHNNAELGKATKLQFLKSSLEGNAASIIQSFQITDGNYDEAWALLNERYNNKRELVHSHLKRLFGQPSMKEESATGLRRLIDTTNECMRALKVLDRSVESWDDLIVFIVTERLDPESKRQWIISLPDDTPPQFCDLIKFLDQRARALAEAGENKSKSTTSVKNGAEMKATMAHHGAIEECVACSGSHQLYRCSAFAKLSIMERKNLVRKHSLCFKCFGTSHSAIKCNKWACKKCNGNHHILLHFDDKTTSQNESTSSTVSTHFTSDYKDGGLVLLSTAIINVTDKTGISKPCRALLDNGSEASFITEDCAQMLGLQRQQSHSSVIGVAGSTVGMSKSKVVLHITSAVGHPFSAQVDALVLHKVTRPLPSQPCDPSKWNHLKKLNLADPNFYQPGKIDVLLGADIFAELLRSGRRHGRKGEPIALQTTLGWIVSGSVSQHTPPRRVVVNHAHCELNSTLRRFWELEEVPEGNPQTPEEVKCEEHFSATHFREENGRFVVRLPFQNPTPSLGASRQMALRRFKQVEARLQKSPELQQHYIDFMRQYEQLGHMEKIPKNQLDSPLDKSCYIPHHAVLKDPSNLNKFRVVFDASAKTTNGLSLNDNLMVGPTLQDDIVSILIRFRFHAVAICADVTKMYRQILVHRDDWNYQRILWREHQNQPIQEYWLKTVTYGTASAPYQATRCVQQLAQEEKSQFPKASAVWLRDAYVDDLMSGAKNRKDGLELVEELNAMMKAGKFELRKWSSNDASVLMSIPPDMRESELPLDLDTDKSVKTLGIYWHPARDEFSFTATLPPLRPNLSKRVILSDMSRVFDPLGWLSPVTIRAKILFQQLWRTDVGWDGTLPDLIKTQWLAYRADLPSIGLIRLPRRITPDGQSKFQLLGFCDASELAYCGVVYLRCVNKEGKVTVNLVAAKTKVAPIKKISLPKLELCGSMLLAKLMTMVKKSMMVNIEEIHGWTDSTIVLDWLSSSSSRWKTFVANRVSQILDVIPFSHWHHIPGKENPADCGSRGISPSELATHPLWWTGPQWTTKFDIPIIPYNIQNSDLALSEEKKTVVSMVGLRRNEDSLMTKYSSLLKLQHITALCLRFIRNLKVSSNEKIIGSLKVSELQASLYVWIRQAQEDEFSAEINCLKTKKSIPFKSKIVSLNPFIDDNGLLRVGGRLQMANISADKKFPLLLPRSHPLTRLIVNQEHLRQLHAGPQLLLASLQRRYWILCGRDVVRHIVKQCVICAKQRADTVQQMMGNLPSLRINQNRPFLSTGVDYAGPFHMRVLKGRGHKQFKAYIALFICFVTRAIHLEAVSDLTTNGFLAALQRFVARRGKCRDIFSDCGSNFVGACKELKSALKASQTQEFSDSVSRYLSAEEINWHFNPPSAPHQGGLWEAGVKSVKFHLRRIIGNQVLNFEEFTTVLTQVEACLNSRPLCPASSDPNDLAALTPGHFLIGAPLTAIPEPSLLGIKDNHLTRWKLLQKLTQQFWKRWSSEYLSRLQQRPKWWSYRPNLQIGDLVLVKDDNLPPLSWPLGRVVKIHPGLDNMVRVVTIKTVNSEIQRPVVKLCHLPIESAENNIVCE